MGASRLFNLGEANAEQNTTEDDFNNWKQTLWRTLAEYYRSQQTEEEKSNETGQEGPAKATGAAVMPLIAKELGEGEAFVQKEGVPLDLIGKQFGISKDVPIKSMR